MKTASIKEIKEELKFRKPEELTELLLRLSKFKKENKELLNYLLYESQNETAFINGVKEEINDQFKLINTNSYYFIKKSVRKILRRVKTYIRYSKNKETEVDLLIFFCTKLKEMEPPIKANVSLSNIYLRQIEIIKKTISSLHEDLQFDYQIEMEDLNHF